MVDTIWVHRCKEMVRLSFDYMNDMYADMITEIRYFDPEFEGQDTLMNYVDNYLEAYRDWIRWKCQLIDEYKRLRI